MVNVLVVVSQQCIYFQKVHTDTFNDHYIITIVVVAVVVVVVFVTIVIAIIAIAITTNQRRLLFIERDCNNWFYGKQMAIRKIDMFSGAKAVSSQLLLVQT